MEKYIDEQPVKNPVNFFDNVKLNGKKFNSDKINTLDSF